MTNAIQVYSELRQGIPRDSRMTNAIQLEPRHTGWRHAALTGAVLRWALQALRWALQALRWALQALLVLGRVRSDALC